MKFAPPFLSCTYRPTMSTKSARANSSWMKVWGIATAAAPVFAFAFAFAF
jgi:hypothetical protein